MAGSVTTLTAVTFDEEVQGGPQPILVDFWVRSLRAVPSHGAGA
jgi:hypothetical protein